MKNILLRYVLGALLILSLVLLASCSSDSSSSESESKSSESKSKTSKSEENYDLSSDASVTSFPEKGAKFGNGQVLTFQYDGSKSNNDADATIGYDLSYVQSDGSLVPMSGAFLDGKGSGTFKTTDSVFTSDADGKDAIMELSVTYDSDIDSSGQITAKNEVLGRYLVTIEVAE